MGRTKRFAFEIVYEDTRDVFAFRDDATHATPDTLVFRAMWCERTRVLFVESFFAGDENEPYANDITSFDDVWDHGEAVRIAVKFADLAAERQLHNARKVGTERLRVLDEELEALCGRFILPWLHDPNAPATEPDPPANDDDDSSSTLH